MQLELSIQAFKKTFCFPLQSRTEFTNKRVGAMPCMLAGHPKDWRIESDSMYHLTLFVHGITLENNKSVIQARNLSLLAQSLAPWVMPLHNTLHKIESVLLTSTQGVLPFFQEHAMS